VKPRTVTIHLKEWRERSLVLMATGMWCPDCGKGKLWGDEEDEAWMRPDMECRLYCDLCGSICMISGLVGGPEPYGRKERERNEQHRKIVEMLKVVSAQYRSTESNT